MRFDIITLFPDMFSVVRDQGITGRAHTHGKWALHTWNPRDYTQDVHRTVDDRPYGGGPGMVMLAQPLEAALADALSARTLADRADVPVILMSPAGRPLNQERAQRLAGSAGAVIVCGRYEGIDQRFIDRHVTEELSLGDFVLSGGEIAALALVDCVLRLVPSVLGHADSALQDSFQPALSGLLDSPHYTRPEQIHGQSVPAVLLSGDHARIARWRREQSLRLTWMRRPDLIDSARRAGRLTDLDETYLAGLGPRPGPGTPG